MQRLVDEDCITSHTDPGQKLKGGNQDGAASCTQLSMQGQGKCHPAKSRVLGGYWTVDM